MQSIQAVDVANLQGNVTFQTIKNNIVINEFTVHNTVTEDGIINLLNVLTRNITSYLTGMKIIYRKPGETHDTEDETPRYFSQSRIVRGTVPYAEFKLYLGTSGTDVDELNGSQIKGARLTSTNSIGESINFASVTEASKYIDDGQEVNVFDPIDKTSDIALMIIWRIGLSSVFTKIIA